MDSARRLPAHLEKRVAEFAQGTRVPVEPRNASTVVLLRTGVAPQSGALELYLLRRHVDMAFAAGMCVFPGGAVDPRDYDEDIDWVGPPAAHWATRLGTEEPLARALICAAVRETFEESGVLFAGENDASVVADTTAVDWELDRRRLEARELSFSEFLRGRGLRLRSDLLAGWGSWLTPVFEPRRFRAWFFVAELPAGQRTRDVSTESDEVSWMSVREAITAVDEGEMLMLSPTYCTCMELFDFTEPQQVLDAAEQRDLTPVEPTVETDREGAYVSIPERLAVLAAEVSERLRS